MLMFKLSKTINLAMLFKITHKRLKFHSKSVIILFLCLAFPLFSFSQADTSKKSMSFDFGLTRDRNINLWPVFKRTIDEYEKDKQLLFPIYRSYQNFRTGEKNSHLLPFFWRDSSKQYENIRLISTYYPSLYHLSKNHKEKSKTFTLLELAPRVNLMEFKKTPDGMIMQNNLLFFLWYKNNKVTNKSYLVVFPAYWQFKTPARSTSTLFPLYSYGNYMKGKNHYSAITPLFWHFDSPKRRSNLLLPIWWNRQVTVGKDTSTSNLIVPLYYSHSDKYVKNKVLFPIVWNFENQRYRSLTIAPLLSLGHNPDMERRHLVLTPFFWYFKRYENESTTIFPIVWSNTWKTKFENYSSFVIFPIYWAQHNNNNKSQVLVPFIWNRSTPYYHSFSIIPLFSVGQSPDNEVGHAIVTPLFWHFRTVTGFSNTLIPIWWYKKSGEGDNADINNVVFPLYWGWKRDANYGNILFPVIWNFKNQNYHTFTFAPLFTTGKSTDGKKSLTAITPLYWKFRTEEGSGQLLFPFWWQNNRTLNGEIKSSSKVALLYWKYIDSERKFQGLFPLAWSLHNSSRQSFTLFPLYSYGKNNSTASNYSAITPLFWHFKDSDRSFNTLFPLWWNKNTFEGKNTKHFNLLVPFYFSKTDSSSVKRVVFPVIWQFKNPWYNSFTFIPLLSYGKSTDKSTFHLTITPLFWHFSNPDGHASTLLPVFWRSVYGDNRNTIIFPVFWSNRNSRQDNIVLFPLVWSFSNPDSRSLTFAPFFSFGSNYDNSERHLIITPLFYNIKNKVGTSRVLFPIWLSRRIEAGKSISKTDILFPFYWSFNNQRMTSKVIFPVAWSFKSKKYQSFTFIPLFSKGQNIKGNKYLAVTPLFWKFDSNAKHRRILIPFYTSYNDTARNRNFNLLFILFRKKSSPDFSSTSILWPIVERTKGSDYKYFRFVPLVWSKKSPEFSYFTIQPFYYHSKSNENETTRILWELFVHKNQLGVKKSNSILWKVATWDRYSNGDRDFRILYLLYSNSNVNGKVEKSFFPFYYITKEKNGNRSTSVLFYFYNSLKRKVPKTTEYYQEERIFWLVRIRSNYRILKQKGIEVD